MVALYILLGLALLICAILFFPFTYVLKYKNGEFDFYRRFLCFRLPRQTDVLEKIVPALQDANSFLKGNNKKSKGEPAKEPNKKAKRKQTINEILEILSLSGILLARFFKHLVVRVAQFDIKVATGDPASTAIAYGAVNEAVASIWPFIEKAKNIKISKKVKINISCDFFSDSPDADINLSFTLRVWQLISIVLSSAIKHAKNMVERDRKRAYNKK